MPLTGDIHPLPPDVIAKIKSSTSIIHLTGVVIELIKNALDANAHTILVSVDFKRGSCIVEDDGDGIPQPEFETNGGLGKAHHTSKFQKSGAFGRKGLFLASLASLALLTVTSRHVQHEATNSVIFHHSRPVARLIPAPAHQILRVGNHGTCVTVNDLFGNMPVRVKSRALAFQKPDELEREWENLRCSLASLILANPQISKMNVTDIERGKRISIRSTSDQSQTAGVTLNRIGPVLTQSGLLAAPVMDSWHVLSAKVPDISVHAAISTVPSPSKKLQFISLGNEPLLPRNGSNILFNEVNRLVSLSDFGNTEASTPAISFSRPSLMSGRSETSMSGRSSTKSVNKWPMFYIRIDSSSSPKLCDDADDISPDSEKSLQRIIDVLAVMILEFLRQQNLRPRASKRLGLGSGRGDQRKNLGPKSVERFPARESAVPETSTGEAFASRIKIPTFQRSQTVNTGQHFKAWSRVKSAKDNSTHMSPPYDTNNRSINANGSRNNQMQSPPERPRDTTCQYGPNRPTSSQAPFVDSTPTTASHQDAAGHNDPGVFNALPDHHVSWTDPRTGKSHLINTRTGQTVDPKSSSLGPRLGSGSLFGTLPHRPQTDCTSNDNIWVDNLLKAWDNPTFRRTELPVSNLDISTNHLFNKFGASHGCLQDIGSLGGAQVAKFRGKIRRQDLADATIISQVDQKFILAKMDIATINNDRHEQESVLVLVDQHAADERCRVEQLFDDMFLPLDENDPVILVRTTEVNPIELSFSPSEQTLFQKYLEFFGSWGIGYNFETSISGCSILITKLPSLIAERCRLEPGLLLDILRREIWTREEDGKGPLRSRKTPKNPFPDPELFSYEEDARFSHDFDTPHSWIHRMSGCPQGIIDLLNSRACRTAIMFNDFLSFDECKTLTARLSQCAFPFQCAHGRPSMIPILDLRPQLDHDHLAADANIVPHDSCENDELDFLDTFRLRYHN